MSHQRRFPRVLSHRATRRREARDRTRKVPLLKDTIEEGPSEATGFSRVADDFWEGAGSGRLAGAEPLSPSISSGRRATGPATRSAGGLRAAAAGGHDGS